MNAEQKMIQATKQFGVRVSSCALFDNGFALTVFGEEAARKLAASLEKMGDVKVSESRANKYVVNVTVAE